MWNSEALKNSCSQSWTKFKSWLAKNFLIVVAFIFSIASFCLGFLDKPAAMGIGAMLSVVFLFMAFLDDLEEFVVGVKEMRFKRRAERAEEEADKPEEQLMKEAVNEVRGIIKSAGFHSYQWFRDHSRIQLSDEQFDRLICENPDLFKKMTIIQRDENRDRIIPGRPGIKLRK